MRGLVLGGGGITGIAWETGLLAGLAESGVDLSTADVVVGTSAGSVVGAWLLGGVPMRDHYEGQLADPSAETGYRLGLRFLARWLGASLLPGSDQRVRRRLGRAALRTRTFPEAEWHANFQRLLGDAGWPDRRLLLTAVDAETGDPEVFHRDSGVSLQEAVAASCAVPMVAPPITIEGRRYVDGGARSGTNADLATGCDRVVVIAPISFGVRRSQRIHRQLASLGAGVRSIVLTPDKAARQAIGSRVLDPARRPAAARAGFEQARSVSAAVAAVWDGLPG